MRGNGSGREVFYQTWSCRGSTGIAEGGVTTKPCTVFSHFDDSTAPETEASFTERDQISYNSGQMQRVSSDRLVDTVGRVEGAF